MMKWLWFLLALPAMAQTTLVVGKLQTYNPLAAPNALGNYVEFQLTNCGNNTPTVSGSAVLLSKPIDFYPDSTGALTANANGGSAPTLYGNDVINCGGAFTSRYSVRYFVGGVPQGPAKFYQVSSTVQFNLTTAIPIGLQPPLNPPYPNLTTCPPGSYSSGLNPDLSVKCLNLPNGASNAVVTNPTATQEIANQPLVLDGTLTGPTATFNSTNGVLNAALFPGSDIGAKVNAALASLGSNAGTIHIPDGTYAFSTTMRFPTQKAHLECGPGAKLNYVGATDAIVLITNPPAGGANWKVDGGHGCWLDGSGATSGANGIRIFPSGVTGIMGMHITGFAGGAGVRLDGANSIEIHGNDIESNQYGIYTTSAPQSQTGLYPYSGSSGFAPNAVHVYANEIANNQWGYFSANAVVPATRGLGNVLRDNVFEGQTVGDIRLGWDAHTIVTGNYFESNGVGVSAGVGTDNVYDIHILRNYFTTNGYRSEVELGFGWNFYVEGNYEEGATQPSTHCFANVIPGGGGLTTNVVVHNAVSQYSEGAHSDHELCYNGAPPTGAALGTDRLIADEAITGVLSNTGQVNLNNTVATLNSYPTLATILGTIGNLTLWSGPAAPIGACNGGAALFFWPAGWSLCVSGTWTAVTIP